MTRSNMHVVDTLYANKREKSKIGLEHPTEEAERC